jgi:dTMP kinase
MPGRFIVIEGTDGSGKATQIDLLLERLKKEGREAAGFDFPRYGDPSCYFVEKYLNGGYGSMEEIGPEKASLFYALDRFDASPEIRRLLDAGQMVVANRYVASNMGHQGSKIADPAARQKFFEWIRGLEYGVLGIPKPDLNIFLHVPAETAYGLVAKKVSRKYINGAERDIHEADIEHFRKTEGIYEAMAQMFPREFARVECAPDGELLPPEEISERIWQVLQKMM